MFRLIKSILVVGLFILFSFSLFSQYSIDYRPFQTPVKSQGGRGTCTAFAISAALEIMPGVPADISEQYLYGALKHSQSGKTYKEGDQLINYIKSLKEYGFVPTKVLPYEKNSIKWSSYDSEFSKMIQGTHMGKVSLILLSYFAKYSITNTEQYRHYNAFEAKDINTIKRLLNSGHKAIPISYFPIHLSTWSKGKCSAQFPFTPNETFKVKINDKYISYSLAKLFYKGDLVGDIMANKVGVDYYEANTYINSRGEEVSNYGGHAVTIVGYNEKGFIFKNSWGENWGDGGYGYISYDAHQLLAREAVVFNYVTLNKPQNRKAVHETTDFILKTTLGGSIKNSNLQLSLFTHDILADPIVEVVEYRVYNNNNKLIDKQPVSLKYDNSFTTNIFSGENLPSLKFVMGLEPITVHVDVYQTSKSKKQTFIYKNIYHKTAEYYPYKNDLFKSILGDF